MPAYSDSQLHLRDRKGFGSRIILIVLAIITLSQVLGTFLSVLSFEKIFLRALTYKYEILGKDLKRKIEQALKFGKPLDRFLGMDRLAEPLFRQSEDLNEIFVSDTSGRIFFTFEKVTFVVAKGAVDEKEYPKGKILLGDFKKRTWLPVEELFDWNQEGSVIRLHQGRYHVMFPIVPPFGGQKGILVLVFSKSVLDEKKKELVTTSRNMLGVAIILTALLVGLLVRFLLIAPARRQVVRAGEFMDKSPSPNGTSLLRIPVEVLEVQLCMTDFVARTQLAKKKLKESLEELEKAAPDQTVAVNLTRLMKEILEGKNDEEA